LLSYSRTPERRRPIFTIEFYSTADGVSELWGFLDDVQQKATTNKDARIQHKPIDQYIQLLEDHGTRLGENITKHLEDDIRELRPEIIESCTSTAKMIPTSSCISSERKHKTPRHEIEKTNPNATIGLPERGDTVWQPGLIIRTMSERPILRLERTLMKQKPFPRLSEL